MWEIVNTNFPNVDIRHFSMSNIKICEIANLNFPASNMSKTVDCVSVATIRKVLTVCVKILGNFLVNSNKLGSRDNNGGKVPKFLRPVDIS